MAEGSMTRWLVGTSGFYYGGWEGVFYPKGLPRNKWLSFYAENFQCLELNVTFYRLPRESTFKRWVSNVPEGFRFVLKVPRTITHIRRLKDTGAEMQKFLERAFILGPQLGALLLQLPPSLKFDKDLLSGFLESVPSEARDLLYWEPRNKTFIDDEALEWFASNRQALVTADSGGRYPTVKPRVADRLYLRFHGPDRRRLYASGYGKELLLPWVEWAKSLSPQLCWVFFNNDVGGHAISDAKAVLEILRTEATC